MIWPAKQLPREVHRCDGSEMTFWDYQPQLVGEIAPDDLARALFELHRALARYDGEIPSYRDELCAVRAVLTEPSRLTALGEGDRHLLSSRLDSLLAALELQRPSRRVLHGSPHDSNVIVVSEAPRLIDFETVCVGPVEWDLAHVASDVARAYPGPWDTETLRLCRGLVSVKTATWCWVSVDHPGMRWHAEHHLECARQCAPRRTEGPQ